MYSLMMKRNNKKVAGYSIEIESGVPDLSYSTELTLMGQTGTLFFHLWEKHNDQKASLSFLE